MKARGRRLAVVLLVLVAAMPAIVSPASAGGLPPIRHVFVIMLENKGYDETFGYLTAAPYLSLTLPAQGALLPNYYGVTHVSLGNYIALVSGQGSNPVTQLDCPVFLPVVPGTIGADGQALGAGCVYPPAVSTLAGQLSAHGLTWKGYMEDMGNGGAGQAVTCRHPAIGAADTTQSARKGDQYATRHNPFVYFSSIIDTPACARDDVPLDRLAGDLSNAATTANFSLITPNLCDDGHDSPCVDGRRGGLDGLDGFLRQWVPRILGSPAYRSDGLLAILFDEADGNDAGACCGEVQFPNTPNNGGLFPGSGGGRVGAVLLSRFIDPGTIDLTAANHFSFLRTVEDLFALPHLGYAGGAGVQSISRGAFTCVAPALQRDGSGLRGGSLIKLAVVGQGTAPHPLLELKLWRAGRVTVTRTVMGVRRHRRSPVRQRRTRVVARASMPACGLVKLPLPGTHGRVRIAASADGATEVRTIAY